MRRVADVWSPSSRGANPQARATADAGSPGAACSEDWSGARWRDDVAYPCMASTEGTADASTVDDWASVAAAAAIGLGHSRRSAATVSRSSACSEGALASAARREARVDAARRARSARARSPSACADAGRRREAAVAP